MSFRIALRIVGGTETRNHFAPGFYSMHPANTSKCARQRSPRLANLRLYRLHLVIPEAPSAKRGTHGFFLTPRSRRVPDMLALSHEGPLLHALGSLLVGVEHRRTICPQNLQTKVRAFAGSASAPPSQLDGGLPMRLVSVPTCAG
jgi:hypothetical protein